MSFREPERNRTLPVLWVGIVVAAILIGIFVLTRGAGDGDSEDSDAPVDPATLVPATDAALMAVALEHVDQEPDYFEVLYREDGRFPKGTLGGDLRFHAGGGDDGGLLRLIVAPGRQQDPCEFGECAEVTTDAGPVTLYWQLEVPEEDPGIVAVELRRKGMSLRVYQSGAKITEDPRELDLEISVDDMVAIVADPRFGLETTPEMVDAGEELFPG